MAEAGSRDGAAAAAGGAAKAAAVGVALKDVAAACFLGRGAAEEDEAAGGREREGAQAQAEAGEEAGAEESALLVFAGCAVAGAGLRRASPQKSDGPAGAALLIKAALAVARLSRQHDRTGGDADADADGIADKEADGKAASVGSGASKPPLATLVTEGCNRAPFVAALAAYFEPDENDHGGAPGDGSPTFSGGEVRVETLFCGRAPENGASGASGASGAAELLASGRKVHCCFVERAGPPARMPGESTDSAVSGLVGGSNSVASGGMPGAGLLPLAADGRAVAAEHFASLQGLLGPFLPYLQGGTPGAGEFPGASRSVAGASFRSWLTTSAVVSDAGSQLGLGGEDVLRAVSLWVPLGSYLQGGTVAADAVAVGSRATLACCAVACALALVGAERGVVSPTERGLDAVVGSELQLRAALEAAQRAGASDGDEGASSLVSGLAFDDVVNTFAKMRAAVLDNWEAQQSM